MSLNIKAFIKKIGDFVKGAQIFVSLIVSIATLLTMLGILHLVIMQSTHKQHLILKLKEGNIGITQGKSTSILGNVYITEGKDTVKPPPPSVESDIFLISRSLNPIGKWQVHSRPIIKNGDLEASVDLFPQGTKIDANQEVQIALISCPKYYLAEGFEFIGLPTFYEEISNSTKCHYCK